MVQIGTSINSDRYLSVEITYTNYTNRVDNFIISNTIDMKTGQVVYLNDLIEVDEELVSLILMQGVAKIDYSIDTGEYDGDFPISSGDDSIQLLKDLKICSDPFNQENWSFKPTFYLQENKLYFCNLFNHESEFYIELDKIEHKLKVEKW